LLGALAVLGAPHDRVITEKIKENLIEAKFDLGIFDSTLAQYQILINISYIEYGCILGIFRMPLVNKR